ncbi:MAG: DUF4249 domain-containing protein [Flammeovirgaceae bacterium]|nr:DUF4249 domain-containing protein [Flammeovirgaceae bacterium]
MVCCKNTFWVVAIAASIGCQKEVELPQLPYESRAIIQGIVEPDSVPIVFFNRTVPYLSGETDPGKLVIRNADVTVSSIEGSDQLFLDSIYLPLDCKFSYFYRGSVIIKKDMTYTLQIIDGSKIYTAFTNTSLKPVTIDQVSYTPAFKDLYGEHEGVITYFVDIPNEDNYYRFEMTRKADLSTRYVVGNGRDELVPCLQEGDTIMFKELGRSVYNDKNLQGQQIKLIIEPALTHLVKVTIYVRIQTIDKATYEFYDQIDGQKLAQYNPFVEPVFIQGGQFGDDAFGFFGSMVRSDSVRFEMPSDD